jgi:carboxylesterase
MTDYPAPVPDAFDFSGNATGVLLIHGFTGSPSEMRPLGEHLAAQGYTVAGPLLPGHGTQWQDLNRRTWREWAEAVERAYAQLQARCRRVFVCGGSLGGLLTLYLAERHATSAEIAGIIPMAPAIFVTDWRSRFLWLFKHLIQFLPWDPVRDGDDLTDPTARQRFIWAYDGTPVAAAAQVVQLQRVVRRDLRRITMPALIFMGTRDQAVTASSAVYAFDHIASQDKELVWLTHSGHCLWIDSEREQVWDRTHRFIAARAG